MIDRLEAVARRYEQLQQELALPEGGSDPQQPAARGRELRSLEELVTAYASYREAQAQLDEARELLRQERDADMQEFLRGEERAAQERLAELDERLKVLLLPRDPNDDRDVVVEIHGAEGGQEAALFAADLFRMYTRWAESRGWRVEVIEAQANGIG